MRTSDLTDLLATGLGAVDPRAGRRRTRWALLVGVAASLLLLRTWLGLNPWLERDAMTWPFWAKAAFALGLAAVAWPAARALARPGGRPDPWVWGAVGIVAVTLLGGAIELALLPADTRLPTWLGHSAQDCPWRIVTLALPVLALLLAAVRSQAPVRPARAGAATGLLAGAAGASVYLLYCGETSLAFLATWYLLGVLGVAALGAALGRLCLRW